MNLGKWIGLFILVTSIYILWRIRQVIFLFFLAVILAIALNRIVKRLERSGVSRQVAVVSIVFPSMTLLGIFLTLFVSPITDQLQELIVLVPEGGEKLQLWFDSLQAWIPQSWLERINISEGLSQQFRPVMTWLWANFYQVFSNSIQIFFNSLLVVVLTLMILVNPQPYRQAFIQIFPAFYRHRINEILSKCEKSLIGWLTGVFVTMSFIGVMSAIGLWVLQVRLPFINALLAALLALIPYLGAILSSIPPIALALLDAPWKALAVIVLYLLIQQVEGNFITPVVMEKKFHCYPPLP